LGQLGPGAVFESRGPCPILIAVEVDEDDWESVVDPTSQTFRSLCGAGDFSCAVDTKRQIWLWVRGRGLL
jgi:hypothetical protein